MANNSPGSPHPQPPLAVIGTPWHVGNTGSSTKGLFSLHQILHLMRQVCNTISLCLCIQYCQSCQSLDFPSLVCLHMLSVGAFLITMQGKHRKMCGKDEGFLEKMKKKQKIIHLPQKSLVFATKSFVFATKSFVFATK